MKKKKEIKSKKKRNDTKVESLRGKTFKMTADNGMTVSIDPVSAQELSGIGEEEDGGVSSAGSVPSMHV